jgi:PhnB protein
MNVQPYLFFNGRCEEALGFYREALGAEVTELMRFRENPEPSHNPPGSEDKIMHAELRIGAARIMASDGMCMGQPDFRGVSLALTVPDAATADRVFAALGEGGQVQMPLGPTFFSPRFGMVADRFGASWMILVGQG